MNYVCSACTAVFPIEMAIDGYAQGYHTGFICPHCGSNLDEDRSALKTDFSFVLLPLAAVMIIINVQVKSSHSIYWPLLIGGLISTLALILVAISRAVARNRQPIKTRLLGR